MKLFDLFKSKKVKASYQAPGGYEGANNYTQDHGYLWTWGQDDETEISYARKEMLDMVRYLNKNTPLLEAIVSTMECYVAGVGISVNAASADDAYNTVATAAFERWAKSPFASLAGDMSFYQMQKLVVRELVITGEAFVVMMKTDKNFPQLRIVKPEQIRGSGKADDKTKDGLYIDSLGRIYAYSVWFNDKKPTRIQAENIIHLKIPREAGQIRGMSPFASALNSVRSRKELIKLEQKNVKIHSLLGAVVKKKNNEQGTFGAPMPVTGSTPMAKTANTAGGAKGNLRLEKALGGQVAYLNEGEDIQLLASSRPTDGFVTFLNEILAREVCMALGGLPYEFIVDVSKLTGPGIRFITASADNLFKNYQHIIADQFIARVYSWVIATMVQNGQMAATDAPDWMNCSFIFPSSITIDAGARNTAELNFLEAGLTSYSSYYDSRGKNYKEELIQVLEEKQWLIEEAKQRGVPLELIFPKIKDPQAAEQLKEAA